MLYIFIECNVWVATPTKAQDRSDSTPPPHFNMESSDSSEEEPRTPFDLIFLFLLFIHSLFSGIPAARKDCLHFTFCCFFDPWQGF